MKIGVGDKAILDDLRAFADEMDSRERKTLSDALKAQIARDMIDGTCKITGSRTDHERKKMWVEFTWEWRNEE